MLNYSIYSRLGKNLKYCINSVVVVVFVIFFGVFFFFFVCFFFFFFFVLFFLTLYIVSHAQRQGVTTMEVQESVGITGQGDEAKTE